MRLSEIVEMPRYSAMYRKLTGNKTVKFFRNRKMKHKWHLQWWHGTKGFLYMEAGHPDSSKTRRTMRNNFTRIRGHYYNDIDKWQAEDEYTDGKADERALWNFGEDVAYEEKSEVGNPIRFVT